MGLISFKRETCEGCTHLSPNGHFCLVDPSGVSTCNDFDKWEAEKIGLKFDGEKHRWDLLPYDALEKVVEIMTYGANKYAPNNWQKVDTERYDAASMRHKVARLKGEQYDKESGFLHIAHEVCNVLFILWQEMNDGG